MNLTNPTHDWSQIYPTIADLERDLSISYAGPGLYLTLTDTVLIIPVEGITHSWEENPALGGGYRVLVTNAHYSETIFANPPPIRSRHD